MADHKHPNARKIALDVLEKVNKNQAYSGLALNHAIEEMHPSVKDVALITQIVYGTLQHRLTLDFYIDAFIQKRKKIDAWVRELLRLSFYQMVYLKKIPAHAAVNEAVTIAKRRGGRGVAGFVNGVLRAAHRQGVPEISRIPKGVGQMAIEYSHPEWLVKRWIQQYGEKDALLLLKANNEAPDVSLRVNALKSDPDTLKNELVQDGFDVQVGRLAPEALVVNKGKIVGHPVYKEGKVSIQDESSMLVARALDLKPGMAVLDACAGPGGKTAHLAELMGDEGMINALDIHKHKTRLIDEQAERLGLTSIHTKVLDAREAGTAFAKASFDRILVDAPCTGFGVIRRKPEIKYQKTPKDISGLAKVQQAILNAVVPLLKVGGKLVYSTCTIDEEENALGVKAFLERTPEMSLDGTLRNRLPIKLGQSSRWTDDGMVQLLPQDFGTDGFFIACFIKNHRISGKV
ncbi:16S rRNA (cytosine(967)-C(5))-methyltransferase RsmB [Camelliibacillus cellulosilyticus]|uniref:16S rRNA (cytosine(967)-C(5))-methyltransferase n=1 Tax=Camelliibacillus cellulosilyticus TaxID=2174486 RepID=A0ABV9GG61_9BACL